MKTALLDSRLHKTHWWLMVGVALIALIVFLSLNSRSYVPSPGHMDKLYHGIAYAVLMGWWLQLLQPAAARTVLALVFIAMGTGLEIMQSFHPLRYFDVWDMLANTTGVLCAWLLGRTAFDQSLIRLERYFGFAETDN